MTLALERTVGVDACRVLTGVIRVSRTVALSHVRSTLIVILKYIRMPSITTHLLEFQSTCARSSSVTSEAVALEGTGGVLALRSGQVAVVRIQGVVLGALINI